MFTISLVWGEGGRTESLAVSSPAAGWASLTHTRTGRHGQSPYGVRVSLFFFFFFFYLFLRLPFFFLARSNHCIRIFPQSLILLPFFLPKRAKGRPLSS